MTLDLQREAEKTRKEEEAFYRQQELMIGAEQQRRSMIMNEEKKLADQRTRYIFFLLIQPNDTLSRRFDSEVYIKTAVPDQCSNSHVLFV